MAEAWSEVCWLFAIQLIALEARIYYERGVDPAQPVRPYRVVRRIEEPRDVVSLVLQPADGGGCPSSAPGSTSRCSSADRGMVVQEGGDATVGRSAGAGITLHAGRQIDDFTTYVGYEAVDDDDERARQGYMDLSDVPLPENVEVFTCGPLPFMRHIRSTLLARGVPASRIRYEVFGPDLSAAQR